MPERARFVGYVLDSAGNAIPSATVEVRQKGTTTKITETIYAADDPDTTQHANPFTSAADGRVEFYLTDQKRVDLFVSKSGYTSQTLPIDVQKSTLVTGYATLQDEGTALTQRNTLNFTGAGVTATDDSANGRTNVTITGGSVTTDTVWDAAGDLVKGTGADTAARLARGSANQVLRVNSGGTDIEWGAAPGTGDLLDWQFVRKTANEAVVSTTTLQNDDELFFAIGANQNWIFKAFVIYYSTGASTPDIQVAFTVPSGSLFWGGLGLDIAASSSTGSLKAQATPTSGAAIPFGAIDGVYTPLFIEGIVRNGATAGNLQMQWAQNTSVASSTTVAADSYLALRRVS